MRELIINIGRMKTVFLVTTVCVFISVFITLLAIIVFRIFSVYLNVSIGLTIAICAPVIVAPSITFLLTGMIFEIHELELKMRLLATYDSLTGILGRRAFMEQTNYICRFSERQGLDFTLLIIDLDHFKRINDEYGHAAGDRVLEEFGRVLKQVSRESDLAGRIGGEEFALFLPVTSEENARILAERIHKAISESVVECNGRQIKYSVSIGLAFFPRTVNNIKIALNYADKALYSAKKNGRNQTVVYHTDMEQ
ncbi:MAG: GGDEF domain-containing protein [Spirochaetes bacterium]|nr:GGDEF domain-containing protein [Spirochaetota bacterium]